MVKTKKVKKARAEPASAQPAPESGVVTDPSRPPGQRLYDMPYSTPAPRLIDPELGLHNLVARAGHNAAYSIDVTLLDAPDHRLIRSGVLVAHRVLDGRGEWFMTAPDWQPLLPTDRIELMGHAELPEEFADLIRPLRRRATLGPVAALRCDRREFALRDDHGTTLGLVRDDKVTVRRGGLTTARYRQVTITPVGPGLNEAQGSWLDRALTQAGANRVPRFSRLTSRLGAPATGPTDIPEVADFDPSAPFRTFVSQVLGLRLRRIVEADLAIRGGDLSAVTQLSDQAAQLRLELKGLAFVLDPDWIEDLYDELDWIIVEEPTSAVGDVGGRKQLAARLRSERYLTLLERLVNAVRAPKLTDSPTLTQPGAQPTAQVLAGLVETTMGKLRRSADALGVDSPEDRWSETYRAFGQLHWVSDLGGLLVDGHSDHLTELWAEVRRLLEEIQDHQRRADRAVASLDGLSPAEAFEAGRAYEQQAVASRRTRQAFVKQWAKMAKKLDG